MFLYARIRRQTIIIMTVVIAAVVLLSGCFYENVNLRKETSFEESVENKTTEEAYYNEEIPPIAEESFSPVFEKNDIPEDVQEKMYGVTISDSSRMGFDDLSYLTLTHIGYDGKSHTGNMIVDKKLADEVISIFKELYEAEFPIEKISLACEYSGVDELSMEDNNTSAFNDRPVTGGTGLSYHQLGRAIDINPLVNPYIKFSSGVVLPENSDAYLDREVNAMGMITADGECVRIFKKYGWTWGGDWKSLKDYQHFEKR